MTPSKTLAAPQPLNIAFPLGNGGFLRSEEGGGFRKEGDGGEGEKKKEKRTRKKCSVVDGHLDEYLDVEFSTVVVLLLLQKKGLQAPYP